MYYFYIVVLQLSHKNTSYTTLLADPLCCPSCFPVFFSVSLQPFDLIFPLLFSPLWLLPVRVSERRGDEGGEAGQLV